MSIRIENEVYYLDGVLSLENITSIFKSIDFDTFQSQEMVVDLQNVTQADSTSLAMLLEWKAQARKNNINLSIRHLPDQIQRLAKISGVAQLFL